MYVYRVAKECHEPYEFNIDYELYFDTIEKARMDLIALLVRSDVIKYNMLESEAGYEFVVYYPGSTFFVKRIRVL